MACANDLHMKIELTDNTPVARRYLGVPRRLIGDLKEYVKDLLNKGFIQRSRSSYSRICVVIKDTSDGFAGQQWFSGMAKDSMWVEKCPQSVSEVHGDCAN
eukprot:gene4473-5067_t